MAPDFVNYARRAFSAMKRANSPDPLPSRSSLPSLPSCSLRGGFVLALVMALAALCPPVWANPERSRAVRAEFMRIHPCPATGRTRGACPGWQVDHITPLKCGGPDAVGNMQWLTVQAHKDKTAREAKSCRKRV